MTYGDIKAQRAKNELLKFLEKIPVTLHIKLLQYNNDNIVELNQHGDVHRKTARKSLKRHHANC